MNSRAAKFVGLLFLFTNSYVLAVETGPYTPHRLGKACRFAFFSPAWFAVTDLPDFEPLSRETPFILIGFYHEKRWPYTWFHSAFRLFGKGSASSPTAAPSRNNRFIARLNEKLKRPSAERSVIMVEDEAWSRYYPPSRLENEQNQRVFFDTAGEYPIPEYNPLVVAHQLGEAVRIAALRNPDYKVVMFNLLSFDADARSNPEDPHFFDFINFKFDQITQSEEGVERVHWFEGYKEVHIESYLPRLGLAAAPEDRVLNHFDEQFEFSPTYVKAPFTRFLPVPLTEADRMMHDAILRRPNLPWKDLTPRYQRKIIGHIFNQMLFGRVDQESLEVAQAMGSAWPQDMSVKRMVAAFIFEFERYRKQRPL